jgi:hypothetical protein
VEYDDDTLMAVTDSELLHVLQLVGYTEEMPGQVSSILRAKRA